MATNLTSTTFLSQYNDDYRDSDHYHRILFNSGRGLQARELTQMQTIIQKELERVAKFIFNEGSIFNNSGNLVSGPNSFAYTYIKLTSLPLGYPALVGTTINDGDLYAIVKAVIPATGADPDTMIVKMINGKTGGSVEASDTTLTKPFLPGVVISTDLGNVTIQSADDAVGKGSFIEVPQFDTFASGHLVMVEKQSLVLSKYSPTPSAIVGFEVTEEIVTTADNIALYDNSGSTPNLTSPGADRLRIVLTLKTKATANASKTFYEVYTVRNGRVSLTRTSDKILAQLGQIIAARTKSQTGDFIEQSNLGEFGIHVNDDSASDDFLSVSIDGGTAFINGNRVVSEYSTPIRIQKPRSLLTDIETKNNDFIAARYGNYFLADSAHGLVGSVDDLGIVNLYTEANRGGSNVGTARVRHVDEYNGQYRIHVFNVALNTGQSLSAVHSIGTAAANFANIASIQGNYDLQDRLENSLIFPMPRIRVNEISSVTMAVGKVYTDTTDGSGVGTINTGSSNTFADVEQWIVQVNSTGALVSGVTIGSGGAGSTSATITGLATSSAISVLAYENVTASLKTKTLKPSTTTWQTDSTLTLSSGVFTLTKADIFKFNKVTDDATGENITRKFIFDNGQRDNFYGPGKGTLKSGSSAPTSTASVEYSYFQHSTPSGVGYFGGKASYPDIDYNQVPDFKSSNGNRYRLTDVIDMRPVQNPANETFSGGIARIEPLPRNGDTITIGVSKYWNPRTDLISLSPSGDLTHHIGPSTNAETLPSDIPPQNMVLHAIGLNPYVLTKQDLRLLTYDNRGYKMSDIRSIENRLYNVERLATLTLTELSLNALEVYDPITGTNIRQTRGLTGDGFEGPFQSEWRNPDYRAQPLGNALLPMQFVRGLGLTYDSDLSANTVIKGNTVWPKYTEEVADYSQINATGYQDVNQFDIARSTGTGYMVPDTDFWSLRTIADKSYAAQSNESLLAKGNTEVNSQLNQAWLDNNLDKPTNLIKG